jgi:hypothetical protein
VNRTPQETADAWRNVERLAWRVLRYARDLDNPDGVWGLYQQLGEALSKIGRQHVQVEYDLSYYGGDYHKVGQFAYLPLDEIDRSTGNEDEQLKTVFKKLVGDPVHIVHYSFDILYDGDGHEWPTT